ncbi:MAG TPA: ChaN family lipoprotein [Noviherbaspirillum sp.]|uniref:ChaN family lipoprotein n=1 Tax=Noviherbaspirillum sp. TaxID=1926288 RepID=UPI002D6D99E6|nr:ChaN family lipoprotein [Noviherbaspirillum sp.]HYD94721.1 ChaN family lipoprotein [Noviherbaspirillum sp.]
MTTRLPSLARFLLCAALALLLSSCMHLRDPHARSHPLTGKIWDVAAGRFVEPSAVVERALAARFVLLGEIHDNVEQHRIQARLLEAIVQGGKRPALVMEQYDVEQQDQLNGALQGGSTQGDKLRVLSDLMRKGWDWPLYAPLVTVAVQQKLPLIAANMPREALRKVAREGYGVLGSGAEARLAIERVWSPERQQQLAQEIAFGHCGKVPDHMLEAIAKSQRARDAVMADMLLLVRKTGGVAIIGRNHARLDMGVPLYLAARAPDDKVLSVGLMEVDPRTTDPAAYAIGPLGPLHDYLWFTQPTRRKSDPCDSIPAAAKR